MAGCDRKYCSCSVVRSMELRFWTLRTLQAECGTGRNGSQLISLSSQKAARMGDGCVGYRRSFSSGRYYSPTGAVK